jgi:hypothetical protein
MNIVAVTDTPGEAVARAAKALVDQKVGLASIGLAIAKIKQQLATSSRKLWNLAKRAVGARGSTAGGHAEEVVHLGTDFNAGVSSRRRPAKAGKRCIVAKAWAKRAARLRADWRGRSKLVPANGSIAHYGAEVSGVWRVSTASFGLAQTLTGFAMAALYAATGGHMAIFALAFAAASLALITARS